MQRAGWSLSTLYTKSLWSFPGSGFASSLCKVTPTVQSYNAECPLPSTAAQKTGPGNIRLGWRQASQDFRDRSVRSEIQSLSGDLWTPSDYRRGSQGQSLDLWSIKQMRKPFWVQGGAGQAVGMRKKMELPGVQPPFVLQGPLAVWNFLVTFPGSLLRHREYLSFFCSGGHEVTSLGEAKESSPHLTKLLCLIQILGGVWLNNYFI